MTSILARKAVLASLNLSRWNGHRIDQGVTDEVNKSKSAASDAGRYNKKLISTEQMAPVLACVTKSRNYHYKMTQPWMDDGARILPSKLFLEYTEEMRSQRIEFETAVGLFVENYPSYVIAAEKRLGDMFEASDYPKASEIGALFGFDVVILPCPDTDDFRIAVGAEHVDDIRTDLERRLKETMKKATRDKLGKLAEIVGHMGERLNAMTPDIHGAVGGNVLRDSLVNNVREIARLLPSFNLTEDPDIEKIHKRIVTDLCKHDAATLRTDPEARRVTAAVAEDIAESLNDFIA